MQSNELKKSILELLDKDPEFRYTVAGYIGYREILERIVALEERVVKLDERVVALEERVVKLDERIADNQARNEERFARIEEELRDLRSTTNRLVEATNRLMEETNALREETNSLREVTNRLVEAQAATEKALISLSNEVGRLRSEVGKLSENFGLLRSEVGKLSENFGFTLEEIAATKLPRLLRDDGIAIDRSDIRLRHTIHIDSREVEVDLYVEGKSIADGSSVKVIGEVKGRIDARDVKRFSERMKGIDAFRFIFGHTIKPRAEEEARRRGIRLYATWM